jgi:hypothetical protein
VQNVWLAPVPGLFLGLVWIIGRPGPVLLFQWEEERAAAFERFVFVIDPGADSLEVRSIRAQLGELGRTARTWIRRCRVANALLCASPAVLAGVWWWASRSGDPTGDALTDVAVPAMLAYTVVVLLFAIPCDRRTRQAVRQFEQFEAPGVLGSTRLGLDKVVMRLIARAEKRSAGEQRLLTEFLWRIAVADRARHEYLHSGEVFEDVEFAVLRSLLETAQQDLRVWARTLPPA